GTCSLSYFGNCAAARGEGSHGPVSATRSARNLCGLRDGGVLAEQSSRADSERTAAAVFLGYRGLNDRPGKPSLSIGQRCNARRFQKDAFLQRGIGISECF